MFLSKNLKHNNTQGVKLEVPKNDLSEDFIIGQKSLIINSLSDFIMNKGGDFNQVEKMYNNINAFLNDYPFYNVECEIIESNIDFKNELYNHTFNN